MGDFGGGGPRDRKVDNRGRAVPNPGKLTNSGNGGAAPGVPGKRTLVEQLPSEFTGRPTNVAGSFAGEAVAPMLARDALPGTETPREIPAATKTALQTQDGSPLPDADRHSAALGVDVSDVRVVTGPAAADAAAGVGARAFAVGHRIFFGAGASPSDDKLLRHELAHVVQQRGSSVSSFDNLRITHSDDAVEREARAVADGAPASHTSAEPAIARDVLEFDPKQYWLIHAGKIGGDILMRVHAVDLAIGSPYLSWLGTSGALMRRAFAFDPFKGGLLIDQLKPLLGDEARIYALVDKGRKLNTNDKGQVTDKGPMEYSSNVGYEIANELIKLIVPSFARLLPRYCRARAQAKLASDATKHECSKDAPEPNPSDVVGSHAIDVRMREAMCSGVLAFDFNKFVQDNPNEGVPRPTAKRLLSVTIDYITATSFWVVVSSLDASSPITAEEVSEELYGSSLHATELIAMGNRFGVRSGGELLGKYKTQLAQRGASRDFLDGKVSGDAAGSLLHGDPASGMLSVGLDPKTVDEMALEQAKGFKATGAQQPEIVKRLGDSLAVFDDIAAKAKKIGIAERLAQTRSVLVAKETEIASAPPAKALEWDIPSSRQAKVLKDIAGGMAAIAGYWDTLVDKADPQGKDLAEDSRKPIQDVADGLVDAASHIQVPELANGTFAAVTPKLQSLPFDLMESLLRAGERTMREVMKHDASKQYKPEEVEQKRNQLRAKISLKREEALKNPAALKEIIDELFTEVGDVQTDTQLIANMDSLDEQIRFLGDYRWQDGLATPSDPTGQPVDENPIWAMMDRAKEKTRELRDKWTPIYSDWKTSTKSGDQFKKTEVKARVKALLSDPSYRKTLEDTNDTIRGVQKYRRIATIITTVVAAIVITIASMGIGTAVGAGVSGMLAGSVAAGTMAAGTASMIAGGAALVTEAAVFTALNAWLIDDKGFQNFGSEFLFNLATFGAMKTISKVYRSAKVVQAALKAEGIAKGVAIGGEMSLQFIAMSASAIAHEKIHGKNLSREEIATIFAQSTGMFIAMAIAGRAAAPLFQELEAVSGGVGAKIGGMNKARADLYAAAIRVKNNPQSSAIADLVKQDKAEMGVEIETLEMIANNEKLIAASGIHPELAKQISSDAANAHYQVKVAEVIGTNARKIGPNQYHCTAQQAETIEAAYGKDAKVEPIGEDKVAGTKTVQITPPEGKGPAVRFTIGKTEPTETHIDATAQPKTTAAPDGQPNLDGVPTSHGDAARWQTNDITMNDASAWAKTSKDGTSFREVYEKWLKQETPHKHGANGLEPVKPKDVSDAAWHEFEPAIRKALQDQKLVIKGDEIVAKLKDKKIDVAHLDPQSPEYQGARPELIKELGKPAVEKFEASLTNRPGDPGTKLLSETAHKVVSDAGMAKLTGELSSCQVMLTGGTTRPPEALGSVKRVDVVVIAPDGVSPEVRLAIEERANGLTLEAGEGVVQAGGPKELPVNAKVMTREQYLGIKAADPSAPQDLRIDRNQKVTTKEEVAAGYDAAQKAGGLTPKGELPKDAANVLTKGLPGAAIDPANPAPGIEAYLNGKNPARKVTVEQLDPRHFVIKERGKTVGTFTIYENATEMARELSTLQKVKELKLDSLEVTGATDAAKIENNAKQTGGVAAEPVKGELVKDELGAAGKATGEARATAVEKLVTDATSTAKALAELHGKAASGEKVASSYKEQQIAGLREAWSAAKRAQDSKKPQLEAGEQGAIDAKLTALEKSFRKADLDATMTLGNAEVATTGVEQGGKVSVDGSQVHGSMGKDGKPTASAGEDVGRYLESLRQAGTEANLTPAELARVEKAFLDAYRSNMKSGGAGIDVAIEFYKTKRALEGVAESGKAAKEATDKTGPNKTLRDRIESLLHDLGLPSQFKVPEDALTLDAALVKRFEAWLADPVTKIGDNPKTYDESMRRLRDYYARDPKGAIELAKKQYGFEKPPGKQPTDDGLITGDAEADAKRMLEYLQHADPQYNDGKALTKEQIAKFLEAYKSGERFDPVTRRWYLPGDPKKTKSIFEKGKYTREMVKKVLMGEADLPMPAPDPGQPAPPEKRMNGFKEWASMLAKLKLKGRVLGGDPVIDKRIDEVGWEDMDADVVRHRIKEPFKDQIIEALAEPSEAELKAMPEYKQSPEFDWNADPNGTLEKARFLHMRRAIEPLESGDSGNIAEDWRARVTGIKDPTMRRQTIEPDKAGDLGTDDATGQPVTLDGKNVLDMIEGTKIVDNKDYKTPLGPKNEPQLNEQLKLAGKYKRSAVTLEVAVKDKAGNPTGAKKPVTIDGVKWSETDPRGVEASADWMGKMLVKNEGLLEFEIWNWKGLRQTIGDPAYFSQGNRAALNEWLGDPPADFR